MSREVARLNYKGIDFGTQTEFYKKNPITRDLIPPETKSEI